MRNIRLNITLDTRKPLLNGKYPIKLCLYENRQRVYITTDRYSSRENYTGTLPDVVTNREPSYSATNMIVARIYNEASEKLAQLEISGQIDTLPLKEIKCILENKKAIAGQIKHTIKDYTDYYLKSVINKESTRGIYHTMLQRIDWFCDVEKKHIEDIDYKFLSDLEQCMIRKGLSVNSRSMTLRCLRALINRAINEDIIPLNNYPFRKFKIKEVIKAKRFPTIDVVRNLYNMELTGRKAEARDLFFISFFLCGANPIDIYGKKKDADYNGGVFSFVRTKTERFEPDAVRITINEQLKELTERYKGKGYVFCFAEKHKDYKTWLNNLRKELGKLGDELGWEHLKFYDARYCWSTFASSLGTPDYVIDKALGHTVNGSLAMSRYVAFDYTLVDKANDKVRDYLILPASSLPSEVTSI